MKKKSHFCSCGRRCNDEGSVEALEKAQLEVVERFIREGGSPVNGKCDNCGKDEESCVCVFCDVCEEYFTGFYGDPCPNCDLEGRPSAALED